MRIFKTKMFHHWAEKIDLDDEALKQAGKEVLLMQCEASLGGGLYKKRVAIENKGKRGGLRTIIAFKRDHHMFFVYGFSKNRIENINEKEKEALKILAKIYLSYNDDQINKAKRVRELVEVL